MNLPNLSLAYTEVINAPAEKKKTCKGLKKEEL